MAHDLMIYIIDSDLIDISIRYSIVNVCVKKL